MSLTLFRGLDPSAKVAKLMHDYLEKGFPPQVLYGVIRGAYNYPNLV